MLLLLPLPFLALGCLCFLLCAAIPLTRRFALPVSLWFASYGFVLTGIVTAFLIFFIGVSFASEQLHLGARFGVLPMPHARGVRLLGLLVILVTAAVSTAVSFLHGTGIRRITFPLFRAYVAAVSFGVGLLAATPMSFAAIGQLHLSQVTTFLMTLPLILSAAALLSWFCFSHARDFRSGRPERFNPVSPAEYCNPA